MSDTFASKFGQLSLRSDPSAHDHSIGEPGKVNGDDESIKNNPWKPISSTDNNALEAEAWPEPSAPTEHRRGSNTRQFDEKPKRKIKWQNFEVDQSSYGLPRGRGRGSVTTHYSPVVNTFRRGFSGFRNRIPMDVSRNLRPNGYFPRHPTRAVNVRQTVYVGAERSSGNTSDTTFTSNLGMQSNQRQSECVPHSTERSSPVPARKEVTHSETSSETPSTTVSKNQQDVQNCRSVGAPHAVVVPKRSYRDRATSDVTTQPSPDVPTQAKAYETGPVGRARRSYLRQHQSGLSGEHELAAQHVLPTNAALPTLFPFQPLSPFAYFIPTAPAMGGPLWGNSIQLVPSSSTQLSLQEDPVFVTTIGSQQSLATSVSSVATQVSSVSGTSLEPEAQPNTQLPSILNPSSHSGGSGVAKPAGGDVIIDVVDVNQMLEFLAKAGWHHVTLPVSLRDHPVIASAINASAGDSPLADQRGSVSDESATSAVKDESPSNKPMSKPDDVVIVDNEVFFVPRNVNRTKFLKFTSKLDYIRHHVEYYFSESNLNRDKHLAMILKTNEGVCPIPSLLLFNRLRWVSTTETELLEAVSNSQLLLVVRSADGSPYGICRFSCPIDESSNAQHVPHTCASNPTPPHAAPMYLGSDKLQQTACSALSVADLHSATGNRCNHPTEPTATSNTTPILSTTNENQHVSLIGAPPIAPQYAQPTLLVNSLPRVDTANTTSGSVAFPDSVHAPQYFPFGLSGHQPTVAQPFAINHPSFYPPQQVAFLTAATGGHPGFISAPVTNGLHTTESGTAFLPTLYRIAPNQSSPALGTCLSQLGGPAAFPPVSNSAVLLQFLPSAQPPHTGGFVPSHQPITTPLLNRALGPISPGGLWIPLPAPSNSGPQSITPVSHALLAFPSNHIVGPHGQGNCGATNSGTFPLHLPFPPLAGLQAQSVDFTHFGQSDHKWGESACANNTHQYFKNCAVGPCAVPDSSNSVTNEFVQSVGPFPLHSRGSLSHGSYSTESIIALESQTAASTRSTPKKNF